jgi:hypothetical protein
MAKLNTAGMQFLLLLGEAGMQFIMLLIAEDTVGCTVHYG